MTPLPLVLLLAAAAASSADGDETPGRFAVQDIRIGGGGMGFVDVDGVAPSGEVGVELAPAERLGLRFTLGSALRVGWGSVFFAPEAVLRLRPRDASVSPYLSAGLQAALLNITKRARGLPDLAAERAAVSAEPTERPEEGRATGPVPLRFSAGPQASLGVAVPVLSTRLDLAARYTLHFWGGEAYSGVALVLTVVGPSGL